jgi:hypothetical protein
MSVAGSVKRGEGRVEVAAHLVVYDGDIEGAAGALRYLLTGGQLLLRT